MKRFLIKSRLVYIFPLVMLLSSIFFIGSLFILLSDTKFCTEHYFAALITAAIDIFGSWYTVSALVRMIEEIPLLIKLQDRVDKFEEENKP